MKKLLLFIALIVHLSANAQPAHRIRIGEVSIGDPSLKLKLVARIQHYNDHAISNSDYFDVAINSPKSAHIIEKADSSGKISKHLYINNLEGGTTSIYDVNNKFINIGQINHTFTAQDSNLFKETDFPGYGFKAQKKQPNVFMGKPVEMCTSNNGKYLWIPYYRRDYDLLATEPSGLALIDVDSNKIIRVFPTAPLPKMVTCSPDNKYISVTNWGDNTVHLIDISSGDPAQFHYSAHFVVDYKLNLNFTTPVDRDVACGLCLRGTVFTPDSKYLFVGRFGGGGIAVFDVDNNAYLGTIFGTKTNVRHLVIQGDYLYVSSNGDGFVERTRWKPMLDFILAGNKNKPYKIWQVVSTGKGARTITLTNDGAYLFATANEVSKISIVRTADMKVIGTINADSYPVGMTIDNSNKYLIVTAQGRSNKGGNSVMIYQITRKG